MAPGDITVRIRPDATTELAVAAGPKFLACDGVAFRDGDEAYCFDRARRTWREAEEHCRLLGGHLADVRSPSDSAFFRKTFGAKVALPPTLWIGLVEPFRRNQWFWMSGKVVGYQSWASGEPNDAGGGEDCGERISRTGAWNDVDCAAVRGFICEGPAAPAGVNGAAALAKTGFKCSGTLVQAGEIPYCIYTDRALSLSAADQFCKSTGGQMAELSSAEKDQALMAEIGPGVGSGDDVWIGLTDAAQEGQWRTAEGSPTRYFDWRRDEPNDVGPGEDCATWGPSDGRWNDLPCDARAESVCRGLADPNARL